MMERVHHASGACVEATPRARGEPASQRLVIESSPTGSGTKSPKALSEPHTRSDPGLLRIEETHVPRAAFAEPAASSSPAPPCVEHDHSAVVRVRVTLHAIRSTGIASLATRSCARTWKIPKLWMSCDRRAYRSGRSTRGSRSTLASGSAMALPGCVETAWASSYRAVPR
jgi:hypothetical protein